MFSLRRLIHCQIKLAKRVVTCVACAVLGLRRQPIDSNRSLLPAAKRHLLNPDRGQNLCDTISLRGPGNVSSGPFRPRFDCSTTQQPESSDSGLHCGLMRCWTDLGTEAQCGNLFSIYCNTLTLECK